jgi:2-dehydropantoate 2-reductase
MLSTAVLGPGGVGGFLAVALDREDVPVTVVAREATAAAIAASGISLESEALGSRSARPAAVPVLESPADVLYVATKALGLSEALERIQAPVGLVVPLLNGFDHVELLRARFGHSHVCAATIRIDADRPATGAIVQKGPAMLVEIAYDGSDAPSPGVDRVASQLSEAGVRTRVGVSEAQILWSKLVMLNALACTTAVSDQSIGFVRSDPEWRPLLVSCVAEGVAVATAEGAELDVESVVDFFDGVHGEQASSMQRDLRAGRVPELDAIQGAVLRGAARHGLECPVIEELAGIIAGRAGVGVRRVP